MQLVQLRHGGLDQSGQRNGLVGPHGNIADPELDRIKERMRPDIPPDLLRVIDAVGLDQQLDEIFVFSPAGEVIRNIGARKFVEHLAAVGLQSRIHSQPERRIGG